MSGMVWAMDRTMDRAMGYHIIILNNRGLVALWSAGLDMEHYSPYILFVIQYMPPSFRLPIHRSHRKNMAYEVIHSLIVDTIARLSDIGMRMELVDFHDF